MLVEWSTDASFMNTFEVAKQGACSSLAEELKRVETPQAKANLSRLLEQVKTATQDAFHGPDGTQPVSCSRQRGDSAESRSMRNRALGARLGVVGDGR